MVEVLIVSKLASLLYPEPAVENETRGTGDAVDRVTSPVLAGFCAQPDQAFALLLYEVLEGPTLSLGDP